MLAPLCDIAGYADGNGLRHWDTTLPLDRPLPYVFAADPVWLQPTLSAWVSARANLERLYRDGRRIILLAAERSLDAPDAPDAARLMEHGVLFALSLAGLAGHHGGPVQMRARRLLAAPGAHLLVSLAPDATARAAAWAAFDPEIHGIGGADLERLTASNWARLASGEPVAPVCAMPPQTRFFHRVLGRGKPSPSAEGS